MSVTGSWNISNQNTYFKPNYDIFLNNQVFFVPKPNQRVIWKKKPENLTQTKTCDIKKRPVLQNHTTADVGSAADLSASRQTDAIQTEEIYI